MWIAKDINGPIKVYKERPEFKGYYFDGVVICTLPKELFPNFTFEDSPKQIVLK